MLRWRIDAPWIGCARRRIAAYPIDPLVLDRELLLDRSFTFAPRPRTMKRPVARRFTSLDRSMGRPGPSVLVIAMRRHHGRERVENPNWTIRLAAIRWFLRMKRWDHPARNRIWRTDRRWPFGAADRVIRSV